MYVIKSRTLSDIIYYAVYVYRLMNEKFTAHTTHNIDDVIWNWTLFSIVSEYIRSTGSNASRRRTVTRNGSWNDVHELHPIKWTPDIDDDDEGPLIMLRSNKWKIGFLTTHKLNRTIFCKHFISVENQSTVATTRIAFSVLKSYFRAIKVRFYFIYY